jgi:hypothetical protein
MTASAEERAEAVCDSIMHCVGADYTEWSTIEAAIAQAIRQAENDTLEEALAVAEKFCAMEKAIPGAQYESEAYHAMDQIRVGIRSLKKD